MSADTIDDLHAAEDMAATMADLLRRAVVGGVFMDTPLEAEAKAAAAVWEDYCRPSCGAEGDPASDECGDDTCGCPCGHTESG